MSLCLATDPQHVRLRHGISFDCSNSVSAPDELSEIISPGITKTQIGPCASFGKPISAWRNQHLYGACKFTLFIVVMLLETCYCTMTCQCHFIMFSIWNILRERNHWLLRAASCYTYVVHYWQCLRLFVCALQEVSSCSWRYTCQSDDQSRFNLIECIFKVMLEICALKNLAQRARHYAQTLSDAHDVTLQFEGKLTPHSQHLHFPEASLLNCSSSIDNTANATSRWTLPWLTTDNVWRFLTHK